jgi:hypothetical protein
MLEHYIFSYVAIDRNCVDVYGNPVAGLYSIWIKDPPDVLVPIQTFQSTVPSITVMIYSGTPYPLFDYSDAVEIRVKQDIAQNSEYASFVAAQTHGKEWHLQLLTSPENQPTGLSI